MLKKLPIDTYMLLLIGTVALAAVCPVSGAAARAVSTISQLAVALLFFLYGARLETRAIAAGFANWRLQLLIVAATYVLFPVLGLGIALLARGWLPEELVTGFIFLAILPSTVQSSIALTALAGGNVPVALCAASFSNMLGVALTPALAAVLLSADGVQLDADAAIRICIQLLLPFVAGQVARPLIGAWIARNRLLTLTVDRGSILLIVYSAFSAGVVAGVWGRLDAPVLAGIVVLDLALLLAAMFILGRVGRLAGLPREDAVSFLFCGVQKSLASGIPIANILFAGHATSLIVLPLMLYHQFQLILCAAIAQRLAVHTGARTV